MSSIYDALQRIQGQKIFSPSDEVIEGSSPKRRIYWVVFVAVIMSSVCTAAVFYGVKALKDGNGEIENIAAQRGPSESGEVVAITERDDPLQDIEDENGSIEMSSQVSADESYTLDKYLKLGGLYYEKGKYDKALLTYTKALRYYRNDARLLNNIGSVLLAKGEMDKAIGYFIHSKRVSKDFVEPVYNMACTYSRMGDKTKALSAFKKACAMNPDVKIWAAKDPDLEYLKGTGEFDAMIRE
jgi:tetratricopeptide (TPR) repeat protein